MTSEVKVDKLSQKGSSGIVITDDIKLSSGKAIKQADGTNLLTEAGLLTPASDIKLSSGKAIKNAAGTDLLTQAGVLGSSVTGGGAGTVIAQHIETMPGDFTNNNSSAWSTFWSPTYTPNGGPNYTTTIYAYLYTNWWGYMASTSGTGDFRINFKYTVTGVDISNIDSGEINYFAGGYNWANTSGGGAGFDGRALKPVTLDGTGNATLTYGLNIATNLSHVSCFISLFGNNTESETHMQFWEVI